MNRVGGIVLAGGRSRRMGVDKATLPFGPELLLQRIVGIVGKVVSPVVVVAAQEQVLPALPAAVIVVRDETPDRGPVEGVAAGLRALRAREVDAAYLAACDTPLVTAAFVRRMIELLEPPHEAVVPVLNELPQPLAGVYRISVLSAVEAMLAENQLRLCDLVDRISARLIPAEELRDVDPGLLSLRNLNTPEDYEAALAAAGLAEQNR